ncbi:hypothetical protein HMPREF0693_0267 [Proteus mirabilis ATCC 29906]|nr:hypothetical protein HMPREF0693_0267 [Proteus mirabilis ATCC 29906]KXC01926.1 hypothetical protein HMPREF3203_00520 [Proteus mirabilis]
MPYIEAAPKIMQAKTKMKKYFKNFTLNFPCNVNWAVYKQTVRSIKVTPLGK